MSSLSSLENSHVRHSILAIYFSYGMVIRPPGFSCSIFLVLLIIDFNFSASLVLDNVMITLIGEERAGLHVVYQLACTLICSHFCVWPFGSMSKMICDS